MMPTAISPEGSLKLHHEGHTFEENLSSGGFSYLRSRDGSEDKTYLLTPQMSCVDPGCTYTCRSSFPITGNADSQTMHVLHRAHTEHGGDMKKAAKVVADELGDQVRFDQHPLLEGVLSRSKRR